MSAMERFFFGEFYRLEGERLNNYRTVGITRYVIEAEGEEIIFFWCQRSKAWAIWKPLFATFVGRFRKGANDTVVSREVAYGASLRSQKFSSRKDFVLSAGDPVAKRLLETVEGDLDRLSYLRLDDWFGEPPGQGQG